MSEKPLVFISCGQFTREEIALGSAVDKLIRTETSFETYFAEEQNTLEGLVSNILRSLGTCAAFVGIMHRRGEITTPSGTAVRGSVWIEQELAIAAFIQHVIERPIEVALYLERGISLEGIRQQLRLRPVEFETAQEVLNDLRMRVATWQLTPVTARSLVVEWERQNVRIRSERHDYELSIDLHNNGSQTIDDWRVEVRFPIAHLVANAGRSLEYQEFRRTETDYPADKRRLYPGDRLRVFEIDYYVDQSNWPGAPVWPGQREQKRMVQIRVSASDMKPRDVTIPMSELENF